MMRNTPIKEHPQRSLGTGDHSAAPTDVFYVVLTTGEVGGERHHRVRSPLFETRLQAGAELRHLRATKAGSGTYSIWKGTTYVEPAEWSYDVVMADGALIRSRHPNSLPGAAPVSSGVRFGSA